MPGGLLLNSSPVGFASDTSCGERGWDNWTFRLGDDKVLRLPSAQEYALAVEKEHRWLPNLSPQLPMPIPVPLGKGAPGARYPFAWSIYGWIDGTPATSESVADPHRFAEDLADFVAALQSIDASQGPRPGKHNWFRGATLRTYEAQAFSALEDLRGHIDAALAREIWAQALEARWDGTDVWFHGDLAQGNLLLRDGHLCAVIDFGTCGVGDPACDLAIAWTLLSSEARAVFRKQLAVDDATWSRGRGWALWKTLVSCAARLDQNDAVTVSMPAACSQRSSPSDAEPPERRTSSVGVRAPLPHAELRARQGARQIQLRSSQTTRSAWSAAG